MFFYNLLFFLLFFCVFIIADDIGHTVENEVGENENVCAANDESGSCTREELKYENYPWFKHYMELYNAMLVDETMDPKFVVYKKHPNAMGWGNRLRGKLSVFILGLVTDRLFLQEHQMFTDNFDPPLVPTKDGKSLVPLQWDFEENGYICDGGSTIIFDNEKLKELGIERVQGKRPSHALYLDWLKEKNISELFEDFDCIEHSAPSSFDARIYVNDLYKKKLKQFFGTRSRMERMRQIFRFLTSRPSRMLLDDSKSLTDSLGFPNYNPSHRIGIQARLFFDREKLSQRLWDHLEDLYLPCVEKMLKKKLKELGIKHSKGEDPPPILIYLTTDDENFRPYLKDKLKSYGNVVFPNEKVVHTSAITQAGTNSAVTEWYVLGQTSSIMTTGSSFGTTAWGIDGELLEIIGTPHSTWGPRLCGPYPDTRMEAERDIAWGHGGNW